MKNKIKKVLITLTTTLSAILLVTTATYAIGSLTPSGTAGDDTQYSLNDIYTKLTDFSDTPTATSSPFTVPGSVSASFNTLAEIYGLLEAEEADLVPENIADGVEIFGVEGTMTEGVDPGLPKTGQTTSYTTGDDGDLETGITLSYTDNSNGTVTDNVTGLVWQKDGAYNATSWQDAIDYCTNNVATLPGSGWRLPNIKELQSIVDYGRVSPSIDPVFTNTQSDFYWSGTTYHDGTAAAWLVGFYDGGVSNGDKAYGYLYARCVR